MSEEKPLLNEFLDWVAGLFTPKASVEDSGETTDKTSQPEPEKVPEESERETTTVEPKPPPTDKEDPRKRGIAR